MGKIWSDCKKSELLKLPFEIPEESIVYDYLLIVPSSLKHDSGWTRIAIIGCNNNIAESLLALPDDIEFPKINLPDGYTGLRMDCSYPHGVLRLWSNRFKFKIDHPYSSTEITAVPRGDSK